MATSVYNSTTRDHFLSMTQKVEGSFSNENCAAKTLTPIFTHSMQVSIYDKSCLPEKNAVVLSYQCRDSSL
jgi:hypothetical protein